MRRTVFGLFDTVERANDAVRDLMGAGFPTERISLLARDSAGEITSDPAGPDVTEDAVAEGAGQGATAGTVLGGALGLLIGLGALVIPGIGPAVAAGTLAATLGTTALGAGVGAAAGGLAGGLVSLGVSPNEVAYYTEGIRQGGVLVAVNAEDEREAEVAGTILHRYGGGGEEVARRIAASTQESANRGDVPLIPREGMEPDGERVAAPDEPPPPGDPAEEAELARRRLL